MMDCEYWIFRQGCKVGVPFLKTSRGLGRRVRYRLRVLERNESSKDAN